MDDPENRRTHHEADPDKALGLTVEIEQAAYLRAAIKRAEEQGEQAAFVALAKGLLSGDTPISWQHEVFRTARKIMGERS